MRVILETDNALVSYDDQKKAIVVCWSGVAGIDEFYLVYNHVIKGFKIFFAHTLMLDLEKFGKLGKSSLDHLVKQVLPMSAKCGLRKLVLIHVDLTDLEEISQSLETSTNLFAGKIRVEQALDFKEAYSKLAV